MVVAFFICWAPFHAQRLLAIYGAPTSTHMITAFGIMTYISGVLYYVSTTINPLLYHIISNKFREAFKVIEAVQTEMDDVFLEMTECVPVTRLLKTKSSFNKS